MQVLVVDVGENHVKIMVTSQEEPREFASGSSMAAEAAVTEIARRNGEWVGIFEKGTLLSAESVRLTRQALRRWENEGGHC